MDNSNKIMMEIDVLTAAQERIKWVFDNFPKIYVSFSGGKDSTVMLHLVAEEAQKQNRKIGVLFIDWEAQYNLTISHVQKMMEIYKDYIIPYWIALPFKTVNAVSQFEPEWICWEPGKEKAWVREKPINSIKNENFFPFYTYAMTFEEFIIKFGNWYTGNELTACFIGIRTGESLNRWRTITNEFKTIKDGECYTTKVNGTKNLYNIYPIYDWNTSDIWVYHGKNPDKIYNPLYDRMYQAGIPIHNMRICEPYGSEQRKGLWLFQIIEPESWWKIVGRVNGANMGAIYSNERGNILGVDKVTLPKGHTWQSFVMQLLGSMPERTREHYKNKIAVYLHWHITREYPEGIPDFIENDCGSEDRIPSWRRICKIILRNDYWCKGLSFSVTKTSAYQNYLNLMKKRRESWKLI